MSFFVYHRFGESERDPDASIFDRLIDEVEGAVEDEEHASVSVIHESEWGLAYYRGGYATYEHVEGGGESRHMRHLSREKVLELMRSVAQGDLPRLEVEPWNPGY